MTVLKQLFDHADPFCFDIHQSLSGVDEHYCGDRLRSLVIKVLSKQGRYGKSNSRLAQASWNLGKNSLAALLLLRQLMEAKQANCELALIGLSLHSLKATLDQSVIFLVKTFKEFRQHDLDELAVCVKLVKHELMQAFLVVEHVLKCCHFSPLL